METLRKETRKETENNENLTSVYVRIEDSIQINSKLAEMESDKLDHLQSELVKTAKFTEKEQREFDSVHGVRIERRCIIHGKRDFDDTERLTSIHISKRTMYNNRVIKCTCASRGCDARFCAVSRPDTIRNTSFIFQEWQCSLSEEEETDKEFAKFLNQQNQLENTIYRQLEEKVTHDKAARYLNKLLLDSKETMQEQELLLAETENSYGSELLELEQLNSQVSHERLEFGELVQSNAAKGKEIDEIQKETKKHDAMIERKRVKILALNNIIEEVTTSLSE